MEQKKRIGLEIKRKNEYHIIKESREEQPEGCFFSNVTGVPGNLNPIYSSRLKLTKKNSKEEDQLWEKYILL